jgi:TraY domain
MPGERVPLGLRVTKEAKLKLDQAALASGRSQSQEAELRLEHTFDTEKAAIDALDLAYGRRWTGLLLALAQVGQSAGTRAVFLSQWNAEGCEDWLSDPYAYDQVVRAVNFVLENYRPQGRVTTPPDTIGLPPTSYMNLGPEFARHFLNRIANPEEHASGNAAQFIYPRLAELGPNVRTEPDKPANKTKTTRVRR